MACACRVHQEVNRLFGLGGLTDGLFLEVYLRAGRWEEAAERLERYVDAMLKTVRMPEPALFSPGVEAKEQPVSSREVRALLLKQLEEEEAYRSIMQYEKGRAAADKLRASLEA